MFSQRNTQSVFRPELEFPAVRAHVYNATPYRTLRAGLQALLSLTAASIQYAALSGSADDAASCAIVDLLTSPEQESITLAFDALPLGLEHTRLVIRRMDKPDPGKSGRGVILACQSATDLLLTGG